MCRSRTVNVAVKVLVRVSRSEADSVCPGEMDGYLWVPLCASKSFIQDVDKFGWHKPRDTRQELCLI